MRQAGERTLWDEIQAAYRWWIDGQRQPGRLASHRQSTGHADPGKQTRRTSGRSVSMRANEL